MSDNDDSYENNHNFGLDNLVSNDFGFHFNFGGDIGDNNSPNHCLGCGGTKF